MADEPEGSPSRKGPLPLRAEVDEAAARHVSESQEAPRGFVGKLKVFLELVKFEHSIFALPYAYIGAIYAALWFSSGPDVIKGRALLLVPASRLGIPGSFLVPWHWITGSGWPTIMAIVWITVAMVGARSFAFAVNRAVDKEIDARNPRTAGRAVPSGLIKAWELWAFAAVVLAAFLYAVWQLHPIVRWLWPLVLAAFVIYPYTKRFTALCHYWLGLCLGLAPIGAWVGITGRLSDWAPWLFGGAVMIWTAGFDMIYATQDIECDVRDHIHSMPADHGIAPALLQTKITHALTVVLFVLAGLTASAGWPYYVGIALAAALLVYENAIVSPTDLSRVNAAFFTFNGVIAVIIFLGSLADRLLR